MQGAGLGNRRARGVFSMYHIARVLFVFRPDDEGIVSSDDYTQATVEMWDDNVFTFTAEPKIAHEIKEGDFVLVDYTSVSMDRPLPKNIVAKIIRNDKGQRLWNAFKAYHEKQEQKKKEKEEKSKPREQRQDFVPPLSLKL